MVVVDLRCHGESAAAAGGQPAVGPHTVDASARDVLNLLRELRMFPNMLVGHSFGGKVRVSVVGRTACLVGCRARSPGTALAHAQQRAVVDAPRLCPVCAQVVMSMAHQFGTQLPRPVQVR